MKKKGIIIFSLFIIILFSCATDNNKKTISREFAQKNYHRGMYYLERGFIYSAENEFLTAVRLDPNNPKIYLALGRTYHLQTRLDLSEALFEEALKIDPNFIEARFYLGSLYLDMKEWNKALKEFNIAKKDEDFIYRPSVYNNLGLVYMRLGEKKKAFEAFKKVIELAPNSKLADSSRKYLEKEN